MNYFLFSYNYTTNNDSIQYDINAALSKALICHENII